MDDTGIIILTNSVFLLYWFCERGEWGVIYVKGNLQSLIRGEVTVFSMSLKNSVFSKR